MRAITSWLQRLPVPPVSAVTVHSRVFVPGEAALDLDGWLLATFPQKNFPQTFKSGAPEAMAVLRFVDTPEAAQSLVETQRLLADFAALLSLALGRRVEIPFEAAVSVQDSERMFFVSYAQILDRTLLGPIPFNPQSLLAELLARVATLSADDTGTIGDAASLLHAATLVFDQEPRSAYTLLVAALEVLSRAYGTAPTEWAAWEDAQSWNDQFALLNLTEAQVNALRGQLMLDKHLRLRGTFRSYCCERPNDDFWNLEYDEWVYPVNAQTGVPMSPTLDRTRRVGDVLPKDRSVLARCLGHSYDLRSRFVHRGHWVGPTDLTLSHGGTVEAKNPLPFSILRQLVSTLIIEELRSRSSVGLLPDIQVFRNAPSGAA